MSNSKMSNSNKKILKTQLANLKVLKEATEDKKKTSAQKLIALNEYQKALEELQLKCLTKVLMNNTNKVLKTHKS